MRSALRCFSNCNRLISCRLTNSLVQSVRHNHVSTEKTSGTSLQDIQKTSGTSLQDIQKTSGTSFQDIQKTSGTSFQDIQKTGKISLQEHMQNVGIHVAGYLTLTAGSCASSAIVMSHYSSLSMPLMVGGFAGSLVSAYNLDNSNRQKIYAITMHVGMGIALAPICTALIEYVPAAIAVTIPLILGPCTMAMYMPKGSLLKFAPTLYIGLWGMVVVSVLGIFLPVFHQIDMIGGIALFMMYSAYDTHVVVRDFENGNLNPVLHACNFSLNAINIFVRVLQLLSKMKK